MSSYRFKEPVPFWQKLKIIVPSLFAGGAGTLLAAGWLVNQALEAEKSRSPLEDVFNTAVIDHDYSTGKGDGLVSTVSLPGRFGTLFVSERPHPTEDMGTKITVRNRRTPDTEYISTPGNIARCDMPSNDKALDRALIEYRKDHDTLDVTLYTRLSRKFCHITTTSAATSIDVSCDCYESRRLDSFIKRITENMAPPPEHPAPETPGDSSPTVLRRDPVKNLLSP